MLCLAGNFFRCMRKFGSNTLLPLDSEIERTCRRNRKEKRGAVIHSQETMNDPEEARNRNNIPPNNQQRNDQMVVNQPIALRDYALPPTGIRPVIRRPAIQANNFELKPVML